MKISNVWIHRPLTHEQWGWWQRYGASDINQRAQFRIDLNDEAASLLERYNGANAMVRIYSPKAFLLEEWELVVEWPKEVTT